MAEFAYKAFDKRGEVVVGTIPASSRSGAEEALWQRGLTAFELSHATAEGGQGAGKRPDRKAKRDLPSFARELATLVDAGLPLEQSLRVLQLQTSNKALKTIADTMLVDVQRGDMLSASLKRYEGLFDSGYIHAIAAGERTGSLGDALNRVADALERKAELRNRIRSALIYPSILLGLALLSTMIVIAILVPSVAPIFTDSGKPLPPAIAALQSFSNNWPFVLLAILMVIGGGLVLMQSVKRQPQLMRSLDRATLGLPIIGSLVAKNDTAVFARTAGSMLAAGVPILQALTSASEGTRNQWLRSEFTSKIDAVRDGAPLAQAIGEIVHVPLAVPRLIAVGEQTATLPKMLLRSAASLEQDVLRTIDRAMSLLTPALTICIALVVGGLVFSVMSAVLSINDLATR